MAKTKMIIKWILSISALFGTIWISLALYEAAVESNPFFVTSSPGGTYTVKLTGQKQRPFFFTNTVNYHASKNEQPFIPSTYIHSGDFMDISFELAYPNHRWLSEYTLQLYREQYITDGSPDTLIIGNRTGEVIKHLKVTSVDQFLSFDLQPNDEIKLLNSRPRGDYKNFYVIGEFYDGRKLEGETNMVPNKKVSGPSTYYIYINRDGATFEVPQ
ncbi:MAG: hypothetical protein ACR2G5_00705 [Pyrinomonadaceae bacterium]